MANSAIGFIKRPLMSNSCQSGHEFGMGQEHPTNAKGPKEKWTGSALASHCVLRARGRDLGTGFRSGPRSQVHVDFPPLRPPK